ncbi:hypothetical protein CC1G_15426 [Coprinopsis cinerea okayama7|uniref:Uncharacterized protein n=1 Tax=Coprinopsis cinerea (strain Okayama-7 / 130 / ATCC MYA-4618 / FGSC 9003) TaxID=240176 RepID=D6RQU1_COPC7|nr:hypothetical protein CC1G_15426 [Coprinopsis cinerea okayama7\|eukprot:XP_002910149.1 hypothetical protein CC1G_15426 [Coprinopsis cinerea okayama7\
MALTQHNTKKNMMSPWRQLPYDLKMETTRHMNIVQLQSFASCNAKVEEPLQEMKRRVFVLLQQFGLYPEEVLTAMKDRCAIISGSAALSVVTPDEQDEQPTDQEG